MRPLIKTHTNQTWDDKVLTRTHSGKKKKVYEWSKQETRKISIVVENSI